MIFRRKWHFRNICVNSIPYSVILEETLNLVLHFDHIFYIGMLHYQPQLEHEQNAEELNWWISHEDNFRIPQSVGETSQSFRGIFCTEFFKKKIVNLTDINLHLTTNVKINFEYEAITYLAFYVMENFKISRMLSIYWRKKVVTIQYWWIFNYKFIWAYLIELKKH